MCIRDRAYPVRAYVKDIVRGAVEIWKCKYLIGADGARSLVRSVSAIESSVKQSNDTYLVAETIVDTDFPDFRRRAAVRSKHGMVMWIPHPHGRVRFYMGMRPEDVAELEDSRFDGPRHSGDKLKANMTSLSDILLRRLPPIIQPYTVRVREIEWISQYVVAQRVTKSFTDGRNVLFVGDSCHSHSPKAAQGMNTGLQDAVNLSWKLSLVLKGCLLYTSPSPRDRTRSRMPSSA